MAKTWRGWAEIEDWHKGRQFRRPSKRKNEIEWRKSALEDMEDWEQEDEQRDPSDPQ